LLSVVDAANRTTRIRLGTSVILSPYHHPLLLAEEIAMADHLSNGRLEVGFARGSYVHEYARLGIGGEIEAGERQTECLDILLGIWAHDDDFEYHGKYYSFPPTYTLPRPYQEPHPPLWMAARSADTMRFAIERGFGLHVSPLRQPMSRLIGQMNLLDALVQELGIGNHVRRRGSRRGARGDGRGVAWTRDERPRSPQRRGHSTRLSARDAAPVGGRDHGRRTGRASHGRRSGHMRDETPSV
jgi:alkanesulfonate monooxygenase SsuD/methylene tetrahydromethanopterin reductase-like flavin-dependent oxidoreductase (luciferase family)